MKFNHIWALRHIGFLFCLLVFTGLFTGCGEGGRSAYYLSDRTTLYKVEADAKKLAWAYTPENSTMQVRYCVQDPEDTGAVYVGIVQTNMEIGASSITALHAETGEPLWSVDCSVSWTPYSCMQSSDGVLYYPGPYDPSVPGYWVYALDLETFEERQLPVCHTQLSNFSVIGSKLYYTDQDGIAVYDVETGACTIVCPLAYDADYHALCFCENLFAVLRSDCVEYHCITDAGMEPVAVVEADRLGVDAFSVCKVAPDAFLYLARGVGDLSSNAMLCAYRMDTKKTISYELRDTIPYDVAFTENGFFAVWPGEVTFYDWEGTWERVLLPGEGTGSSAA